MRFQQLLFLLWPVVLSAQTPAWQGNPIVPWSAEGSVSVQKWDVLEITLKGPRSGNPFKEVDFSATFRHDALSKKVHGFYDAKGVFKIRFMPEQTGEWSFITSSNEKKLDNVAGVFHCVAPDSGNHGPVRIHNTFHFVHADGTPFYPTGTTAYIWAHQPEGKIQETLASLSTAPFNKVRMMVFPMFIPEYSTKEPQYYPFPRRRGENEFSEFNVEFFQNFENRILNLMALGIQADVILYNPYDRWGYNTMSKEQDDFYVSYIARRLSAFRNVWWTIGLEYDRILSKSLEDWDRFFRIIYENDPYDHLRSIMGANRFYDQSLPWVSHVTVQSTNFNQAPEWRETFQKPVIYEMVQYEGNIILEWGRISAPEMVNRIWKGLVHGAYVTHGETIKDPKNEWIWWSTGGPLLGQSPERIAFLRRIIQDFPQGLEPIDDNVGGIPGDYYLYYFGESKPNSWSFELPAYREYTVELIDAWNQTITPMDTTFGETFDLELPGKSYMAVRIKKKRLVFPEESVQIISNGTLFLNKMIVQLQHRQHDDIYYTLDGTPPTQQANRYNSAIVLEADTTQLKAISFSRDGRPSTMVSRTFYKSNPLPAVSLDNVKKGVNYQFYFGLWDELPDFTDLRIATSGVTKSFDLDVREQNDAFGLVFESFIEAPLTDVYTFTTLSDDGSKVYLNDQLVVDNDGRHAPERRSGQIGLQAGFHKIRVEFFEAGGGEELEVYWTCSVIDEEEIPGKVLFIEK